MRFGSVCSGIEAASEAWAPLGWKAAWFSEIEPFPCAYLAERHPNVPNLGDMRRLPEWLRLGMVEAPDVLCGGTPCQAFSLAGLRGSLDDTRGNLTLTFCDIANAIDDARNVPSVVVWENVPGVLSTKDNAFGCFLAGLAGESDALVPAGPPPKPGRPHKWPHAGAVFGPRRTVAWRTLDAQFFGLAQRRKRVFVVASARNDFDPCAVLFEFDGVRRDFAPSREAGQDVAGTLDARTTGGGFPGSDGAMSGHVVASNAEGSIGLPYLTASNLGKTVNNQTPVIAFSCKDYGADAGPISPTLRSMGHVGSHANGGGQIAVAHSLCAEGFDASEDGTGRGTPLWPMPDGGVRRLMPVECERLQGFADGKTATRFRGKPAADGPRYRALGNSWAVPVVAWIGNRINQQLS